MASSRVVHGRPPSVIHTAATDRGKLVTLIAGIVCCSRETADEVFMTRSFNVFNYAQW